MAAKAHSKITLPPDVVEWVRKVFRTANEATATKMTCVPNIYEAAIDMALIEALSRQPATQLGSGWIVRIDTHFLGSGRHWENWEIADIGVLIVFRKAGQIVRSKVALLQSKRLYPDEQDFDEDRFENYRIGFGRLFPAGSSFEAISAPRLFTFSEQSCYKALHASEQTKAIEAYQKQHEIPVHYLLYHPLKLPFSAVLPSTSTDSPANQLVLGARVMPSGSVHSVLHGSASPTVAELVAVSPEGGSGAGPGWMLETFVADRLLQCLDGYIAEKEHDEGVYQVFNRRSAPISSAFSVTFDAP